MRETELLNESQNYLEMFSALKPFVTSEVTPRYWQEEINWARTVLKRRDRITWWLRIERVHQAVVLQQQHYSSVDVEPGDEAGQARCEALKQIIARWVAQVGLEGSPTLTAAENGDEYMAITLGTSLTKLKRSLTHLMGLPCEPIQNYRFDRQSPERVLGDLNSLEEEWKRGREEQVEPEGEVLIDFHNGWAWYKLDRASCDKEADAMGHCGNQFGVETDRLLSLRHRQKNGMDRPSLTFIIDQEGYLGEMKGRANNKPDAKYHSYIIALLRHPIVKGLKGGGYEPENNFHISDLTPEERENIYQVKPDLMTCSDYLKKFGPGEVLAVKMRKALEAIEPNEDAHPTGLVEFNGEYIYALSSFADWIGAMRIYGDNSIDEVLDAEVSDYIGSDGDDELLSSFVSSLPDAAEEKIMEYINSEADEVKEKFGDDWLEEYDWATVLNWIQAHNVPSLYDLENVIRDAHRHGYEVGTENQIIESLRKEAHTGFGRHFQLDTEAREDGRYYLWCKPDYFCALLDDPNSTLYQETNLDLGVEGEALWDEKPSLSDDISHYLDSDADAEYEYFLENCPEECRLDIPPMRPVEDMTPEEVTAELLSLRDPEWLDRYYGGNFADKRPAGLKRERRRRYGVAESLTEAHHQTGTENRGTSLDSTALGPIKRGDTVRVFHGFREPIEALRTAKLGLSGASRVPRVYSYEADNNPKGLFVTMSLHVAAGFVGSFGTRTIMEFVARTEDLEAPVWPNGRYTVQGEFASYFGHGHQGRRNRIAARKAQAADLAGAGHDDRIHASDDPMLASSLLHNGELQALFIGHLSPRDITAFWVETERGQWHRYTVEQYLAEFGEGYDDKTVMRDHWHKAFAAGDEFDGEQFLRNLSRHPVKDLEQTISRLWHDVLKAPPKERARTFLTYFEPYLWPKQVIPAMQWMRDRYGRR